MIDPPVIRYGRPDNPSFGEFPPPNTHKHCLICGCPIVGPKNIKVCPSLNGWEPSQCQKEKNRRSRRIRQSRARRKTHKVIT